MTNPAPGPRVSGWTAEDIRALGLHTDVRTAAAIFGISRSTAYELIDRREFPLPVLRLGTRYRIAVGSILTALGLPPEPGTTPTELFLPLAGESASDAGTAPPAAANSGPGLDEPPAASVDQAP